MQLSVTPNIMNFKALMISPSGQKAIEDHDRYSGISLGCFLHAEQKKRENDKYVDAVIVGIPRGNGNYHPVMHIHDKVTDECMRSHFQIKQGRSAWGGTEAVKAKDGRELPLNTVMITDAKGTTRYFTLQSETEAGRFINGIENDSKLNMDLGLPRMLEEYYRDTFETGKIPKDKYASLVFSLKKEYGKPFNQVVPDIIKKENLLGQGREKDVYKIDNMPDYVLCVKRDSYNPNEPVKPFEQCFQSNEITDSDEPIMANDCMYVKKYIGGKSHSLPNWYNVFHGIEPLTYNDVNLFISQLEELSSFPAKSYVNLAREFQKLNENNIRIDTINPNNLLIDSDLKTINIIDMSSEDNKRLNGINTPINNLSDMEALMLDSMMFMRYYDMATGEDKIKLNQLAKEIIKKCEVAEKVTNLGNSTDNTETYAESIDERIPFDGGGTRLERLEEFYKHFGDLISHEKKDPKKEWEKNFFGEEYLKKYHY